MHRLVDALQLQSPRTVVCDHTHYVSGVGVNGSNWVFFLKHDKGRRGPHMHHRTG